MKRFARSPDSAEPLTGTVRSESVSWPRRTSSSRSRIRWSITGTIGTLSIRSRSIVSSTFAGSNLRRSTIVEAVSIASPKCAKPHWWNSGGAISTFSRPRSGIEERIATAAPMPGEPREAPFGVPVVPEVRIVWRPSRSGGSGVIGSPPSISSSSVGSDDLLVLVRPRDEALAAVQRVRRAAPRTRRRR